MVPRGDTCINVSILVRFSGVIKHPGACDHVHSQRGVYREKSSDLLRQEAIQQMSLPSTTDEAPSTDKCS